MALNGLPFQREVRKEGDIQQDPLKKIFKNLVNKKAIKHQNGTSFPQFLQYHGTTPYEEFCKTS